MNTRPMLADNGTIQDLQNPNAGGELKLDGTRSWLVKQEEKKGIWGRPRKGVSTDFTDRLKEVREAMEGIPAGSYIMDVEIVYFDPVTGRSIFEGSQRRCSTQNKAKQRKYEVDWPIQAIAFDLIHLDGKMLHNYPWETRKQMLQDLLKDSLQTGIKFLPHTIDKKQELYNKVTARGEEGIMVKRLGSRYEEGCRSRSWLKVKHWHSERAKVIGYTEGNGKRDNLFGSLMLAKPDDSGFLVYCGKVGTGFSDAEVKHISGLLKAAEIATGIVTARDSNDKAIMYTPVDLPLEVTVKFQETTKRNVFRMPSMVKDKHGKPLIHYNGNTIQASAGQQTDLKALLERIAREK